MEKILDRVLTVLWTKIPFLSSIIREARIIASEKVPNAAIDSHGWIYINPEWFKTLDFPEQVWVLAHECLHPANFHSQRVKDKEQLLWNIAGDVVIYTQLTGFMRAPREVLTPESIERLTGEKDIDKKTDIEIYEILKNSNSLKLQNLINQLKSSLTGEDLRKEEEVDKEGQIIQEGSKFNDGEMEEIKEGWKRAIVKAYTVQKMAGTVPGEFERMVDEIIKPKLDPRSLLKQFIQIGIGKLVISDWRRQSRKHELLPGHKLLTVPTIWCLVDTSGSIDEEKLKLAMGTIYTFAGVGRIRVVCWDAKAYETLQVKNKYEVLSNIGKRLKGGGGTIIAPALEKTLKEMKPKDIIIVITDGIIGDKNDKNTKLLFYQVANKSSGAIICWTEEKCEPERWYSIKLS